MAVDGQDRISLLATTVKLEDIGGGFTVDRYAVDLLRLDAAGAVANKTSIAAQKAWDEAVPGCRAEQGFVTWQLFVGPDDRRHVFARCTPRDGDESWFYYRESNLPEVLVSDAEGVSGLDVAFDAGGEMHIAYGAYGPEPGETRNWPQVYYRKGLHGETRQVTHGVEQASSYPEIWVDGGGAVYIVHGAEFLYRPVRIFADVAMDGQTFVHERVSEESEYSRRQANLSFDEKSGRLAVIFQIPLGSEGEARPNSGWWVGERPLGAAASLP